MGYKDRSRLIQAHDAGAVASVVAGVIMIGWITGEIMLLKQPPAPRWTEAFYLALGVVMITLALAVWWR